MRYIDEIEKIHKSFFCDAAYFGRHFPKNFYNIACKFIEEDCVNYNKKNYLENLNIDLLGAIVLYQEADDPLSNETNHKFEIEIIEKLIIFNNKLIKEKHIEKNNFKLDKKKSHEESITLLDFWLLDENGSKEYYEEVINILLKFNIEKGSAFIIKEDDKFIWQHTPKHNSKQYIAAFLYRCIECGWIKNEHSAKSLRDVFCRTFNSYIFDEKPLKSILQNKPNENYLKPFAVIKKK